MAFITKLMERLGILEAELPPGAERLEGDAIVEPVSGARAVALEGGAVLEDHEPGPVKEGTRRVTLRGLLDARTEPDASGRERDLAEKAGLNATFEAIYATAGIAVPEHGWTVERTRAFIGEVRRRGMTPVQTRASVERALVDAGATGRDIALDAVVKDETLDLYESHLERRVEQMVQELADRAADLETEIAALRARVAELGQKRVRVMERLADWKQRKADEEKSMAEVLAVLGPLLEGS